MNALKKIFSSNLFVALLFLLTLTHTAFSLYRIIITAAPDFSIYYYSTLDLLRHINPYTDNSLFTIYNYPTASNLLFLPLLFFSYPVAQGLFLYVSFAALVGIIYFSIKIVYQKFSWKLFFLFLSLALLSFPVKFTFGMGQSNLIGYFFLIYGYFLYKRQKPSKAGIAIAIGILFKPVLAFLLLFFLLQKAWKLLVASLSILLLCNAVAFLLYPKETTYYITSMFPHLFNSAGREVYFNQGFIGFVARITNNLMLRSIISFTFNLLVIALIMYQTIKIKKQKTLCFALFLTALPMIDALSWQHHFVFLIFPFILLTRLSEKRIISLLLVFLAYMLVSGNIKYPGIYSHMPYAFILSHVFYGTLLVFILLMQVIIRKKPVSVG